jgi:toxin ParE1/3/4
VLPIIWRPRAQDDLERIIERIAKDNPFAAKRMQQRLSDAVIPLSEHPYLFVRSTRMPTCREIVVHPNYILIYRVGDISIDVVRILHARQQYPK